MKRRLFSLILSLFMVLSFLPAGSVSAESTYCWPLRGVHSSISQDYHSDHKALDITGGTRKILAAKAGTVIVVYSGCNNAGNYGKWTCRDRGICNPNHGYSDGYCNWGYGRGVIIKHADGSGYSQYAHMSDVRVSQGQYVNWGQELGDMGNYGMSTGTHLHFALTESVSTENPDRYINFTSPINPYDVDYTFTDNSGTPISGNPVCFDGFTTNDAGYSFLLNGNNATLVCNLRSANDSFPLNRPTYGTNRPIVKYVGVELYKDGIYVAGKTEEPDAGTDIIQIWYDVNKELGHYLSDGNYTYRFYADIGTKRFYSETLSFTFGNPQNCTVSFDTNGADSGIGPKTYSPGESYGVLPIPSKTGYDFAGWTDGKNLVTEDMKVTGDITLYAQWNKKKYTVSFSANADGEYTLESDEKEVTFSEKYGSLPKVTRKGAEFAGWYTKAVNGSPVTENTIVKTASDHTLYAHWDMNFFRVFFDPCGGITEREYTELVYGSRYDAGGKLPVPVKDGYRFLGWATDKTCGEFVDGTDIFDSLEDITLYAVWVAENAVISEISVNTDNVNTTVKYGEKFSAEGLILTVKYSDGTLITTQNGFSVISPDTTVPGNVPVSIVFDGKITFFGITVLEKADEITGISKIYPPEKIMYAVGEKFDPSGMEIEVSFESGRTEIINTGFALYGYDTSTPGTKTVTVSYEGFFSAFEITVKEGYVSEYARGDVNKDGSIDAKDATQILRSVNGKTSVIDNLTEDEILFLADVNADESVDAKDATQILRYVNGKSSVLN